MSKIAGIIYPNAFQVTEMIREMHVAFPAQTPFQYFHHKNLELGAWNSSIATNEAKNSWATVDGDIYNKEELRDLLKKEGFHFSGESDSELIVYAYEAWQEEFLRKLNGPFALALFDEQKETLLIARDRLGQKPLYWTAQGEYWLFATEIKGLIATGIVPQTPSISALASYLSFGFIPQDLSPIHNVNKLLPCHYLKVDLNNRQTIIGQYWSLSEHLQVKTPLTKDETYEKLGNHIEEAVRISLPKEGMIGSFLVGDLGSSAMTWFLSHAATRERINAYSAVFEEPNPVELNKSSEIAKIFCLKHEVKKIQPEEVIAELPRMIWYLDEPIADPSIVQTWHLGKLAFPHCRFVYADLGWKEMLGGSSHYFLNEKKKYPPHHLAFFLAQLPSSIRDQMLLPILKGLHIPYLYRVLRNIDINRDQVAYLMNSALFNERERKKISPTLYHSFDPEVFTQRFHRLSSLPGSIDPSLYYDAKTELPDRLLIQFERLLTPHSIHTINPFLDYRLVEFLAEIPEQIKFEPKQPGALLHNLMMRLCHSCPLFPERTDSFIDTWKNNAHFRDIFSLLLEGHLVDEGLISPRWIRNQLGYPYLSPRTFKQLWAVMVLEVWFRLYIAFPMHKVNPSLSLEEMLKT